MVKTFNKAITLWLSYLLIFGMMVCTPQSANAAEPSFPVVLNGGFESDDVLEGKPDIWENISDSCILVKQGSEGYVPSPAGGNYLQVTANGQFPKQVIKGGPFEPGTYILSAWVKYSKTEKLTRAMDYGAYMHTILYDVNENVINFYATDHADKTQIFNTCGEWRMIQSVLHIPENVSKMAVVLASTYYDVTDLCWDGIKLEKDVRNENEKLVYGIDFNETTYINNVEVPAQGTVKNWSDASTYTTTAYGTLGTNYKSSADTQSGTGKSMEMYCDGTSVSQTAMEYLARGVYGAETFSLTGWIKLPETNNGYASITARKNYCVDGYDGVLPEQRIYKTENNGWQRFNYTLHRVANDFRLKWASATPYGETFNLALQLSYTGTGTVLFDDVRIDRVVDESFNGVGNLALNGNFEGISTVDSAGKAGLYSNTWSASPSWLAPTASSEENGVTLLTSGGVDNSKCVRVNAISGANYLALSNLSMKENGLYKISWWQKGEGDYVGYTPRVQITAQKDESDSAKTYSYCSKELFHSKTITTEWQKFTIYFYWSEEASRQGQILFRNSSGKIFYIDNVELIAMNSIEDGTMTVKKDGIVIETPQTGDITVERTLVGENKVNQTYTQITAAYRKDGDIKELLSVDVSTLTAEVKPSSSPISYVVTPAAFVGELTIPSGNTNLVIESFLWDGLDRINPITKNAVLE